MFTVHIELQRVQTWLFATPRLRTMVGANVLLGETLRLDLRELLVSERERAEPRWQTQELAGEYPERCPDDPLNVEPGIDPLERSRLVNDDPAADAKVGILSRDGGHFEAAFPSEGGARAFARAAVALLRSKLPGLRFGMTLRKPSERDGERIATAERDGERIEVADEATSSIELPVLARCSWAGRGLASAAVVPGGKSEDLEEVSIDAARRHHAAQRADKNKADDLVTHVNRLCAASKAGELRRAKLVEELADEKFLAVIHADGNGVGGALGDDKTNAERAAFFHRNRVLLRRAVVAAIGNIHNADTFDPCKGRRQRGDRIEIDEDSSLVSPILPLMLGGDDLLIACRADVALPLVVGICEKLDSYQSPTDACPLTLGVGVVIASYALPFYQLHHLAETLASSAKRTIRGRVAAELCSVVDWQVFTASGADDDLAVARRRDWVRGDCVLSRRPLQVLNSDGSEPTLQWLVERSQQLAKAPRSQLHYLKEQLASGERLAELAFAELPARTKEAFPANAKVWEALIGGKRLTSLLDLIEVTEIGRLGRATAQEESR